MKNQTTKNEEPVAQMSKAELPSVFALLKQTLKLLLRHWKTFGMLVLMYGVLCVLLVQGSAAFTNSSASKGGFDMYAGDSSQVTAGLGLFTYLIGAAGGGTSSPTSGLYQIIFLVLFSLAVIWTLRQAYNGHAASARGGLYYGMTPLIPFLLVLSMICFQLLPLAFGALLYNILGSFGLIVGGVERVAWVVIFVVFGGVSLYFISSSLFALYIVTLPDMTPMRALRSARELVRNRRWTVLRKLLFLPLILFIIGCVLVMPFIIVAAPLVTAVFFMYTLLCIPLFHGYMYHLYRALV
jgi:hypothetical protein